MRRVLFFRDFGAFTGGHLKVWHYFEHLRASEAFDPQIYFSAQSRLDETNPWVANGVPLLQSWEVRKDDVVFLGGIDWLLVPCPEQLNEPEVTIVNLVQSVRHADPSDPKYSFLDRPATRICVSDEVAIAIKATGRVNGLICMIRAGIDQSDLPSPLPQSKRDVPILIAGFKNPSFAQDLSSCLSQRKIDHRLLIDWLPRPRFLDLLSRSSIAILLPTEREGCFLPPLEAMHVEAVVICPDVPGTRGHCIDRVNCMHVPYRVNDVVAAVEFMSGLSSTERAELIKAGREMVDRHNLLVERAEVMRVFELLHSRRRAD
jgi:glycosyltransferase involved in cell wall biosynthesis